jgi:hypothetical protein
MYRKVIALCTMMLCMGTTSAHDMTPTYPKWEVSHVMGIYKTQMELFNKRSDVNWYEIGVFTKDWEPVQFVSDYRIMRLDHLSKVKFSIYINAIDVVRAKYICSVTKLRENSDKKPMISSKICSKIK